MPIVVAIFIVISTFLAGNSIVNHQVKSVTTKVETPFPSPTPTHTPTPVPQVKVNQIAPTPYDPIVDCGSDWQKVNGKTIKAKKSLCDSWVDCQIGDKNIRGPKSTCDDVLRKIEEAKKQNQGMVNCQIQSGWVRMTQDDCTKAQNAWGNQILDSAKQQKHAETLQQAEQYMIQNGLPQDVINAQLQKLEQDLKAQGL